MTEPAKASALTDADVFFRVLFVANMVLFALLFLPSVADRLFGNFRFAGWRADVVLVSVSGLIGSTGTLRWTREPGPRRTTSRLCLAWMPCYVFYVGYAFIHMFG